VFIKKTTPLEIILNITKQTQSNEQQHNCKKISKFSNTVIAFRLRFELAGCGGA